MSIQFSNDQGLIQPRKGRAAAIRGGDAALAAILQFTFVAAVVGVRHETLVLDGPGPHGDVGDELVGLHVGGRHQDQLGTGQGQASGIFRKLQVVADQEAELPTVELDDRQR
ncbi:hypothetical protein D3C76_1456690 [compost metagenome]